MKHWTIQLAEAIEMLNQAGVVHRFIRTENIILSSSRDYNSCPRLASFDFACLYWDAENSKPVSIQPRALPVDVPSHLLDHLPPECFTEGYNGSDVDCWSLGAIVCVLLTGNSPFVAPDLTHTKDTDGLDLVDQWKRSDERRMLPEEIRSLLDDIFKPASERIQIWEIAKDCRLTVKDSREFKRKKLPPYYRIDLNKVSCCGKIGYFVLFIN